MVYVITNGEFNEIQAVFTSKEKAEEYWKYHSEMDMEEYEESDYSPQNPRVMVSLWYRVRVESGEYWETQFRTSYVDNYAKCYSCITRGCGEFLLKIVHYFSEQEYTEERAKELGKKAVAIFIEAERNGHSNTEIYQAINAL